MFEEERKWLAAERTWQPDSGPVMRSSTCMLRCMDRKHTAKSTFELICLLVTWSHERDSY